MSDRFNDGKGETRVLCKHCSRAITFDRGHWRHEGGVMMCPADTRGSLHGTMFAEPREGR